MAEPEESKEPEEEEEGETARDNGPSGRPAPIIIIIAAVVVLILIIGGIYLIISSGSELESLAVGNITEKADHIEFPIYATPSGLGDYTGDVTVEIFFEDRDEPLYSNKVKINDGNGFEEVDYEEFIWDNGEYIIKASGDGKESTSTMTINNVVTAIHVEWVGIDPASDSDTPDYFVDASISYEFGERSRPSLSYPQGYSFDGGIEDPEGNDVPIASEMLSIQKRIEHSTKGTYTLTGSMTNTFCRVDSPYRTVQIENNKTYNHDASPFSVAGNDISMALSGGEAVVNFDASSSWDDGSIVRYEWGFGDNATTITSTQATIQHTYAAAGTYYVTLIVVDDAEKTSLNGKASTMVVTITES